MSGSIGIVGADGRLGRRIRAAAEAAGWDVTLAATSARWALDSRPEVIVDVSHRSALAAVASYCRRARVPLVHGVSGLGNAERSLLERLSADVAVVRAPNFSYGHLLQRAMLEAVAGALGAWEATVVERHPRTKLDRPSATALELAALCGGEIASVRGGLPVSDHTVVLAAGGETVAVTHAVADLSAAAAGAVRAADWIVDREPGLWSMHDVYDAITEGVAA